MSIFSNKFAKDEESKGRYVRERNSKVTQSQQFSSAEKAKIVSYKEESVKDLQRLYASRITEIPVNRPIQEVTERTATATSI